jgi:hypothetical protein
MPNESFKQYAGYALEQKEKESRVMKIYVPELLPGYRGNAVH